ncbi:MAG TPA: Rne/Rng family ribonuclease [Streptosporangiaceae bacterium]|nr:Rne/Rng family ribonuclease [Streptosporangiaceae bacterium]
MAPEAPASAPASSASGRTAPATGSGQATGRATKPVPAIPVVPAAPSGQYGDSAPATHQPVPVAAFQAPVVVFQPPDLSERRPAEQGRSSAPGSSGQSSQSGQSGQSGQSAPADDAGDDSDAAGGGSRRRRRGGRGRGKGQVGEGGNGSGQADKGGSGSGQGAGTSGSAQAGSGVAGSGAAGGSDQRRGQSERAEAGKQDGARNAGQAGRDGGDQAGEDGPDDDSQGGSSSRRRRRRRQRSGSSGEAELAAPDDPTDTVVHIREPRPATETDDVRAVKGSTRLEAKRQRRRESRDTGRRRPPIISESEFLARREAVERVMLVRQQGDRTQIAVLEDGILVEHYVDKASHQSYVGNVYLGKVQNVLPSMEAAFVDIGKGRNAVLYAGEVNFDATGLEGVAKRIESALKSGQSIMVQVTKDPIGHKGARLTSQVSLPGRYLVYVPGASMTGISRKLPDTERNRLKQILKKVAPEEGGIIVRTAAEGASEEELLHDVTRLVAQWQAIERKAKTASSPDLLYGEPDLTIRVVRDIFNEDFTKLVIASDSEWDLVDEYVRYVAPNLSDRLERWSDEADLFAAYRIDEQLGKALDRKVWLPSGGSLVIDTTEAMTVIDVNTGKFTGQGGNLEQTVTRNNLEAAEEIVRQLRLRDIGGIIVIDFIDMVLESNRDLVLRRLIECLARDRTKHQVAEVTSLGLVQMTRKRVGSGLLAAFSVPCEHCNGRGVLISTELTEHPHPHGRGSQQVLPKPGPARSRSNRSKAIAQVAAKTMDIQPGSPEGASPEGAYSDGSSTEGGSSGPQAGGRAKENGDLEVAAAGTRSDDGAAALVGSDETPGKQSSARGGSGRSGSGRSRRSESGQQNGSGQRNGGSSDPEQAAKASAGSAAEHAQQEHAQQGSGQQESGQLAASEPAGGPNGGSEPDQAEPVRKRTRRSAYREAGPPDAAPSQAESVRQAESAQSAEPVRQAESLVAAEASQPGPSEPS